jgi:uncharacterized protein
MHPFKVYFWDLGVRNNLIDDFGSIGNRDDKDVGAIWENFCVIERIKKNEYGTGNALDDGNLGIQKAYYFWRTNEPSPKEYDLIEEKDGKFSVFEMKWNPKQSQKVKTYPAFFDNYKESELNVIDSGNWTQWLL